MILQQQYAMVQGSREILLSFVETSIGEDLNTPVPAYANKTIRQLLEHSASCYFYWLAYFALEWPLGSVNCEGFTTVPLIRGLYHQVDELITTFLEKFSDNLDLPLSGEPEEWGDENATPLQLFTHVVTHEFHHKGQILVMSRQLGYIPPDTDVRLSFS